MVATESKLIAGMIQTQGHTGFWTSHHRAVEITVKQTFLVDAWSLLELLQSEDYPDAVLGVLK